MNERLMLRRLGYRRITTQESSYRNEIMKSYVSTHPEPGIEHRAYLSVASFINESESGRVVVTAYAACSAYDRQPPSEI